MLVNHHGHTVANGILGATEHSGHGARRHIRLTAHANERTHLLAGPLLVVVGGSNALIGDGICSSAERASGRTSGDRHLV